MGKVVNVEDARFNGIRAFKSKKGNDVAFVRFVSLEMGEMELFVEVAAVDELKEKVGEIGSLDLELRFEGGREKVSFRDFRPKNKKIAVNA